MTAIGIFLLMTVGLGWSAPTFAQDIAELQGKVEAHLAEIAALRAALSEQTQAGTRLETDLARLQARTDDLEQAKERALDAMTAQFERIILDPALELTETRTNYRAALEGLRRHEDGIKAKETEIARARQEAERIQRDADDAERALAELRRGFDVARVERLFRELNVDGDIRVENAITCRREETIGACMERGNDSALDEAKQGFTDRIYASATEADLIAGHRDTAVAVPVVIDSEVTNNGFRGQGDYFVALEARMRSRVDREVACALLALTPAQCSGDAEAPEAASEAPPSPSPPTRGDSRTDRSAAAVADERAAVDEGNYKLTVRSNVYRDEVYIDGTSYGSTRLDVILPRGEYDLEVRKPGHKSFKRRVTLDREQTVIADLPENAN